jgi:signal transduction histidine kinase
MLNRIAHILTSVTDLPQALDLVTESVAHLFEVNVAFIGQLDAAQTELTVLSRFSHDCALPGLMRLPVGSRGEANLRHELLRGRTQVIQKGLNCPFLGPMGEHVGACDIPTLMLAPLRARDATIGVLGVEMAHVARVFTPDEISLAETIAASLAAALENARLFDQAGAAAAEEERNRMARDLHDSVSQVLFSAGLVAEVLPSIWDSDPEEALESLEELRRLTRGALAEFRTMLLELRPTAVTKTPLGQLMAQLTEAVTSRTQLPFRLHIENVPPLPGEVHTAFYRIAQEALNNVVKHAGASQVTVRLQATDPVSPQGGGDWKGQVTLSVEDDGRGFTPESRERERLGMGIMRERAESIGARLSIESQVGQATQVRLVWG